MASVLLFSIQIALGVLLPWWVVRRDQRRLSAAQLAQTWNDASFWAAIVAFGPLCIPVHFIKARRSLGGVLLGAIWMIAVLAAISVADWLLRTLVGAAPR